MKGYILVLFLVFFSCEKQEKSNNIKVIEKPEYTQKPEIVAPDILKSTEWFQYYQKENPAFSPDKFVLQQITPIAYAPTSVVILNEKGFNEIYKPFLIFSKSGGKYLDLDSYQWFIGPDGHASFEADQQIVLVDYRKKKAQQIAFFGPSYWIEAALWKGDSVAVLLGNSYEKVPFKIEFNFENNKMKQFSYPDTLQFKDPYSKFKLEKKGIKIN